ncbi:hypothetical protein XENOCAPTIV_012416 [Xenoophorus captivus]|uniref:Uncharacterized protein n=1 Tax=Xenoophorus captivus TaxID=1517983 RepID=A0ABV0RYT1_9TELE
MISRGSRGVPRTEPAFFISVLSFLESLVLLPQQIMTEEVPLYHNRPTEDLEHLAANTEGQKLPQVHSALSLLLDYSLLCFQSSLCYHRWSRLDQSSRSVFSRVQGMLTFDFTRRLSVLLFHWL